MQYFSSEILPERAGYDRRNRSLMDWDTPVTLFIANIAPTLPDTFIRTILTQFGSVREWRRAMGVKKEPCDFGFVDYGSPTDALQAMRIIPKIKILNMQWNVRIDNNKKQDIVSFDQARKMRSDFDDEKERQKDRMILGHIEQMIEGSAFAEVVPRLEGVLYSRYDDDRTAENFRYLREVKEENDELEERFRENLIAWRKEEAEMEHERAVIIDAGRAERDQFLRNWTGDASDHERFLRMDLERRKLREMELEIDRMYL